MLNLKHVIGTALDMLGDLMAVSRSCLQRPQDQHVERAAKEFNLVAMLSHGRTSTLYGRVSTINKYLEEMNPVILIEAASKKRKPK
jgi:hypothetical protein